MSASFPRMSAFNPLEVRREVEQFTPRRPQKFRDLFPAKAVIAELRQKHASYSAIAEFLTKHCLPTGKTAVAMFCHEVLGESVRPYHWQNSGEAVRSESKAKSNGSPDPAPSELPAPRGPRIARVRMLNPPDK